MRVSVVDDDGAAVFEGTLEHEGDQMQIESVTIGGMMIRRARIVSTEILVRAKEARA